MPLGREWSVSDSRSLLTVLTRTPFTLYMATFSLSCTGTASMTPAGSAMLRAMPFSTILSVGISVTMLPREENQAWKGATATPLLSEAKAAPVLLRK